MFRGILCFLLLQVYFSKARLQDNAVTNQSPDNRDNKFLDCNARNLPDEKQELLNSDALVLQPRGDDSQLNLQNNPVLEPVRTKRPYVYDRDAVDNFENKNFVDNPAKISNVQNPEGVLSEILDEDSRRKGLPEPQKELKDSNLSDPTVLSKLVENCLTRRLLLAQKAGQLNLDDYLNSRRSNSYDSVEKKSSLEDGKDRNDEEQLVDPTEVKGLRRLNNANKMVPMINHKRVCYACTSASSPNCWVPNRMTTVKYCLNGHDSCTTKTYQAGSELVVVRDCGDTCASTVGIDPVYKSCSVCQTDLCNTNGAPAIITSHGLILGLFLISIIKAVS